MNKFSGTQQINTDNGVMPVISALQRDSLLPCNIIISPNTNIVFKNNNYGGLLLPNTGTTITTTGGSMSFYKGAHFLPSYNYVFAASKGKIQSDGTSFHFYTIPGFPGTYANIGLAKFAPGSSIADLTMNTSHSYDSLMIDGNVDITGTLYLTNGHIKLTPTGSLHFTSTASVVPVAGSASSFVDGRIIRTGITPFSFPVGLIYFSRYAPLDFSNYTGPNDTYTVNYSADLGSTLIDPTTLAQYPAYQLNGNSIWDISPAIAGGTVDIKFNYSNNIGIIVPSAIRMAHFDGTDWNDINGIVSGASNTVSSGNITITGIGDFGRFAFSAATGGVVPVKLTDFDVRKINKVVKLYWTTEQEINSKSFIIERSSDQIKWNEITRLNAAGNSSVKINYNSTDYNPAKGINYYRLKQVDVDGRFNYSEIRSLYFGNDVNIVVAPNPAKDKVTVYLPGNPGIVSIKIFSVNGQLMKEVSSGEASVQIDLSKLAKGIYTIKVNGKNINEAGKLFIE